ncbi:MAG: hypothetical protein ACRDFB_08215, partial [Rhabdochlamydiaceae bacterium]
KRNDNGEKKMVISLSKVPCPTDKHELFCTQFPALEKQEAQRLTLFFNTQKEDRYFKDSTNGRWGLKKENSDFSLKEHVTFNQNGQVEEESVSAPYTSYTNFNDIKPIIHKALNQMAQRMQWKHEKRSMAVTFMQHQLTCDSNNKGIKFHRDDSHYTMVYMLDDPDDPQMGWKGGDLLFRPDNAEKGLSHRVKPLIGYGILFSNQGTQHSVTSIEVQSARAVRTIMTIHDYGQIKELSLWQKAYNYWFLPFLTSVLGSLSSEGIFRSITVKRPRP